MQVLFGAKCSKKIIGNQVKRLNGPAAVMTEPAFFGKKPVTGKPGRLKGKAVMSKSEDLPAFRRILTA